MFENKKDIELIKGLYEDLRLEISHMDEKIRRLEEKRPDTEKQEAFIKKVEEMITSQKSIFDVVVEVQKLKDLMTKETATGREALSPYAKRRLR